MRRPLLIWGTLALAMIALDQWIKYLVVTGMDLYQRIELLPFLSLYRTENTGISFSLLAGQSTWLLIAVALAVTVFILVLAWRSEPHQHFARAGFALIVAGAVGNLIDRATLGYVVDYVLFHTPAWSFAVFNLADANISVGAAFVILQELVDWRRPRAKPDADGSGSA